MTAAADVGIRDGTIEGSVKRSSSKARRRPWKKRVRNIILSPVHLVRRYVFRKGSSKKRPQSKVEESETRELTQAEVAVQAAKQRKIPCYFLFLGASQSGKSTTISKLFNGERPNLKAVPAINVHHNSFVGDNVGIKVVDTPGLLGANPEEEDERTIAAIRSFLKRDIPTRIPTVTFITARLADENDDEQQLAQFTQMLKELAAIRKYFTDECCSNIVLLLTHAQSVEISEEGGGLPSLLARYQEAFSSVFPTANCPVPVIAIENFRRCKNQSNVNVKRYHDIIFDGLRDFAEQRRQYPLLKLVNWISGAPRRFSVSFTPVTFPISRFPTAENFHPEDEAPDSASDTDCETNKAHLKCGEPYFLVNHEVLPKEKKKRKSRKGKKQSDSVRGSDDIDQGPHTLIPEGSKVLLSNKTWINIEDCLVGDKLLGMNPGRHSVIAGIGRENLNDLISRNTPVGTLYCSVKTDSDHNEEHVDDELKKKADDDGGGDDANSRRKLIYAYQNEQFVPLDVTKVNERESSNTSVFYSLELDTPDGTFILNGYPCYSRLSNNTTTTM